MNFLSSLTLSPSFLFFSKCFVLFSIWAASKQVLYLEFKFLFMTPFLVFFLFYLHRCCLLNIYMFLLLIQQILSWFVYLFQLSIVQLFSSFFLYAMILFQHLLQCLCEYHLFLHEQWTYIASIFSVKNFVLQ